MFAYHNDPDIKAKYVNRMKAHMKADALTQGTGWDGQKGCDVGCTFKICDHARGPIEIGVSVTLMRLEECIFVGLPEGQDKGFRLAFLEAIPVGADLSMVWPQFALWLLSDPQYGVLRHCDDDTRPSVEAVADLYRRWIGGEQPSAGDFKAAARAAARAAGAWAAVAAVEAEAWAPRAAARATEAAAWAAGVGFWVAARDELLRLLRETPVSEEAGL